MTRKTLSNLAAAAAVAMTLAACGDGGKGQQAGGLKAEDVADMLHAVLEADRTVYTRQVINRLTLKDKVIEASEHFAEDKALPLPAQMFRFGSEHTSENTDKFSYALLSLWPINKQNAAKTDVEKKGLEQVAANKDQPFYGEETLGDRKYLTAVYADNAIADACVSCHNDHKDSPRKDFKLDDVMGGVVIRIPVSN